MAPPIVVVGKTVATPLIFPPGIVAGAAYTDLDAMGTGFSFQVPYSGVIQSAIYYDLDDEGLALDLWLFSEEVSTQTDNAALALTDSDLFKVHGRIQFTTTVAFADATNGMFQTATPSLAYVQPNRRMWGQLQARGIQNIAAANQPAFRLTILSDE